MTPKFEKGDVVYCPLDDRIVIVSQNEYFIGADNRKYVSTNIDFNVMFNACYLPKQLILISKHDFQ